MQINAKEKFRILLIEDNAADARMIQEMLKDTTTLPSDLIHVERLQEGMEWLGENGVDVLLLNLRLPDSRGFSTFAKVRTQAPQVPIIVLTELDDETLASKVIQMGAQDYLVKGKADGNLLSHAIRYGIERHKLFLELSDQAFIDELTGLYNRRAFLILVKQHFKLAKREGKGMWLLFADLDGLKGINDAMGHNKGDQALIATANLFKKIFRESSIIARVGGDEFVILAIGSHKDSLTALTTRFWKNLEDYNRKNKSQFELSLSLGTAYYDPEYPCSVEELIAEADKSMYRQKQVRHKSIITHITEGI